MSIKRVKEEPTSGQWVEVWECAGFIWSATYDRSEEPKTQYNPFTGDYVEPDIKSPSCKNIQYFVHERDKEKPNGMAVKRFELTDIHALYAARPDLVRMEANASAINAALRNGMTECSGLNITEETITEVRR